jgi:CRISPR-associated protein Cmr6
MVTYLVPSDTARLAHAGLANCQNMGLLLTRFTSREAISGENAASANDRNTKERDVWFRQITAQVRLDSAPLSDIIAASIDRWIGMTGNASRFQFYNRSRLIVGLGGKGALEIGITLHHTTGLPYIPGSALKGLARAYALLSLAAELQAGQDELEQLDTDLMLGRLDATLELATAYREIFGFAANEHLSESDAGKVIFYDAILFTALVDPPNSEIFSIDVMTPHFSDYYRANGGADPHDADKPNPVSFLTVNEGLIFGFAVGTRGNGTDDHRKQARAWLRGGLTELGIGAKTASGYGIFAPVPK